jgi:hypothetical protein
VSAGPRGALALGLLALGCGIVAGCGDDSETPAGAPTRVTKIDQPPPLFPAGRWQGRLAQRGLKPFQVRVRIRSRSRPAENRVAYTGIDCGGNWAYLGNRGPDIRFREVIDRGRGGNCKGTGVVTLRYIAADRLRYEFRGGGVSSSGFLRPIDQEG